MKEVRCPSCGKARIVDDSWKPPGNMMCNSCRESPRDTPETSLNIDLSLESQWETYRQAKRELIQKEIDNPLKSFNADWGHVRMLKPRL